MENTLIQLVITGLIASSVFMTALWEVQRRTHDAGVVDVGWAFLCGALAVYFGFSLDGNAAARYLTTFLAAAWAFRLSYFLLTDRVIGKPEDGRYQSLRAHWGEKAQRNFFFFFQAQAVIAVGLSLVFTVPMSRVDAPSFLLISLAVAIWILSVGGESIADRQLAEFRANPDNKGKTCRLGLWRYSRHPNYFFEWLHWWVYVLLSFGASGWWWALFGPLVMFLFVTKLTGIPYTEKRALQSRGDDYRSYQKSTSSFFPWFPKEEHV